MTQRLVSLAFAPLLVCCTANIEGPPKADSARAGSNSADAANGDEPVQPSDWSPGSSGDPTAAGPMPLRRLTRIEYSRSLRDLFGADPSVADALPNDIAGSSGFSTAPLDTEVSVRVFMEAAESVAAAVEPDALVGCDAASEGESACATKLIEAFGKKVYRRPLSATEVADYQALYSVTLAGELDYDHESASRGVLEAMLQSPAFLYHWELGPVAPLVDGDGVIALGPWEIAARLSFFLWGSTPDDTLLAAAESGALSDDAGIEAQARRLLGDDRALPALTTFYGEWLGSGVQGKDKSPELYPTFGDALASAMEEDFASVALEATLSGSLDDLLLGTRAYVDAGLAALYGVSAPAGGSGWVDLPAERPGLLTRAAFLAATANAYEGDPTKRGIAVRKQLLCDTLTPPPANVPELPAPAPDLTVRERHEQHIGDSACSGCHALTDYIGFGFGNFDAIGGYHTLESGKAIDPSGKVAELDGADVPFANVAELMNALAGSDQVRGCVTRQFARYALGRREVSADDYSLGNSFQSFESAGFSLSALVLSLVKSRSFRFRAPAAGEVTE